MNRRSLYGAIVACLLPIVAWNCSAQTISTKYQIEKDQSHPDFALPNIETGEYQRLSDFRGKKVLLLHFASW